MLTSVLARHGDTVIFDAGRKSIGIDFVYPPLQGYEYEARYYAEEHALLTPILISAPDWATRCGSSAVTRPPRSTCTT